LARHRGLAFGRVQAIEEVGLVGSLLSSHEPGRIAGPDRFYVRGIGATPELGVAFALLVLADAALAVACHRRGLRFPAALCGTAALASLPAYVSALTARGNPSHHILAFAAGIGLALWLGLALAAVELVVSRRRVGPRHRGLAGRVAAGACLLAAVAAVTVQLERRPFLLVDVDTPELTRALAVVDARPGERIVVDSDLASVGLLLWVVVRLAEDDVDVRVAHPWALSATPEQATPDTWDRTIYLGRSGHTPFDDASWRAIGAVPFPGDVVVTVYSHPGRGAGRGARG
jgi:hypothetical protein